jgi:hypothetical protein
MTLEQFVAPVERERSATIETSNLANVRPKPWGSTRHSMTTPADLEELEEYAEFERQQFMLYDGRRLAAENHANAVAAAALTVVALVAADYARKGHPALGWFIAALIGAALTVVLASRARSVSWSTPALLGGARGLSGEQPAKEVGDTLRAVRAVPVGDRRAFRENAHDHWHARSISAWRLGRLKDRRLRQATIGFVGPIAYFVVRLAFS